ncbi:hypothetical protein CEK28_07965 [Xenophilus sp. AP218F]|nr:hypothetical protein CEK28_07965 [Xenophilus sp. AP218F]
MSLGYNSTAGGINATALGNGASAAGLQATALGGRASAAGADAVALGRQAEASHADALALGREAKATNTRAMAFGSSAAASGIDSLAIGQGALASGQGAVSLGWGKATTNYAMSLGYSSTAGGVAAVALGYKSTASAVSAVAVGFNSLAGGDRAVALGYAATAEAMNATALGTGSHATHEGAQAFGWNAKAGANRALAVGGGAAGTGEASLALGSVASASGLRSVAMGDRTSAAGVDAVALGRQAEASHADALALGREAKATNTRAMAFGKNAAASGIDSLAIGQSALASGQGAVSLGWGKATADYAMSLGYNSTAGGINATALGNGASAAGLQATALGDRASAAGVDAVALGRQANASQGAAMALGKLAQATKDRAVAIGSQAEASGLDALAAGTQAKASGESGVALGWHAQAAGVRGMALGYDASAGAMNATALGTGARATHEGAQAFGWNAKASNTQAMAFGKDAAASGVDSLAIGWHAQAAGVRGMALGYDASAGAMNATALGTGARATHEGAQAFGWDAKASNTRAMAFGKDAAASGIDSLAIGQGALASGQGAVALGAYSTTNADLSAAAYNPGTAVLQGVAADSEVSLGNGIRQRRLTNLAAGAAATDAVNVSQLQSAATRIDAIGGHLAASLGGAASYDAGTGEFTAPSYTFGETTFHNVGDALGNLDGRVVANSNSLTELNAQVTNIHNGASGLVRQDATSRQISIAAATDGEVIDVRGTRGEGEGAERIQRKLSGLADAALSETSSEAVTGRQLNATNGRVADLGGHLASSLGAAASYDAGTGEFTAPSYTFGETTFHNVGDALGNLDGRVVANSNSLTELNAQVTNIHNGASGLVRQDATSRQISIAAATDGEVIDVRGTRGEGEGAERIQRKLSGLADAALSETSSEAVTGRQLNATNAGLAALQGLAVQYDDVSRGSVTFNPDGAAVRLKNVANGIEDSDAVNLGQLKSAGMVNEDGSSNVVIYSGADKSAVRLAGINGTALGNLQAGSVTANSMDAVNGSQLYGAYQSLAMVSGGGAAISASGTWSGPTYTFSTGASYDNVGDALGYLDSRVSSLESGSVQEDPGSAGSGGSGEVGAGGGVGGGQPLFDGKGSAAGSTEVAQASGANSTAAGANAEAKADHSVALGANSVADRENTVSVGSQQQRRAITNVMAGTHDHDAVNMSQLRGVQSQVDGLQQKVVDLRGRLDVVDTRVKKIGAMSTAMSMLAASVAGMQTENRMAISTGVYRGQSALAIGYQRKLASGVAVTVGGSYAGASEYSLGAGVGYGW